MTQLLGGGPAWIGTLAISLETTGLPAYATTAQVVPAKSSATSFSLQL